MSQEILGAEDEPKKKHFRRVGVNLRLAVQMYHQRKQLNYQVNGKEIARRFGVSWEGLRTVYSKYTRGELDLGVPQTPMELKIAERDQHEQAREVVNQHISYVLEQYRKCLVRVESLGSVVVKFRDETKRGEREGKIEDLNKKLSFLRKELAGLTTLKSAQNEGYASYLEDLAASLHKELPANPNVPIPKEQQTSILRMDDRRRGLEALRKTAQVVEQVPAVAHLEPVPVEASHAQTQLD